ncbi:MAG: Lrp/AsnC family transcriptional regulator [Burkholderiaceae bacterium]
MQSSLDCRLIAATCNGLPLVPRPFDAVGATLGVSGAVVRARLTRMLHTGAIHRLGAVLDQRRLGYLANGLAVWDVDDARVDELGEKVGALDFVSHCYLRPRALPEWPFNLHVMVHARSRREAERALLQIRCLLADACRGDDMLYSKEVLKQPAPPHSLEELSG